jgi:hypothetical protein
MANMNNESLLDASMEEKSDDSMNVSAGVSVGSSTEDEEEMLQISTASLDFTRKHMELINHEVIIDDNDEGRKWGEGSLIGKAANKPRDFNGAYERLLKNYFMRTESTYNESDFERRFCMPRAVFCNIWEKIRGKGLFVESKINFSGNKGIHPLVRLTACIRRLAYGDSADRDDENLEMAESIINKSFKEFAELMKGKFGSQYLNHCPSATEIERSTAINAGRGFPGMFASLDCKHFSWKNTDLMNHLWQLRSKQRRDNNINNEE